MYIMPTLQNHESNVGVRLCVRVRVRVRMRVRVRVRVRACVRARVCVFRLALSNLLYMLVYVLYV